MDSFYTLLTVFGLGLLKCYHSFSFPFIAKHPRRSLSAVVLVADGTEELEAVTTIDLLRRAGVRVMVTGVNGTQAIKCKYGCVLTPDISLDSALSRGLHDLVVVPGGEEACNIMAQSEMVGQLLRAHVKGERYIAATTAGPIVLDAHRINYLQRLTSAPQFHDKLKKHYTYFNWEETIVDRPGRMITGRFTGSIFEFGLALINHVADKKTAEIISYDLQPYSTLYS